MKPALFTMNENGYPLLDGIQIPCVHAFTLEAEAQSVAELTMKIYVRLDPEFRFDRGCDEAGSDGRERGERSGTDA